ncbi:MAG: hypothetical protein IPP25_12895 [Saprospiraceae bacterium]|nr:hypothetical protein [Candidatus Opimibacter skivensis]
MVPQPIRSKFSKSTQGPQVDLGQDIQACEGDAVPSLQVFLALTILWQDGSTDPDFKTNFSGQFILQASNNRYRCRFHSQADISGVPLLHHWVRDTTLCDGTTLILKLNCGLQELVLNGRMVLVCLLLCLHHQVFLH